MNAPSGEIEHINFLSEQIGALFLNEEYSDVTFVVEGKNISIKQLFIYSI